MNKERVAKYIEYLQELSENESITCTQLESVNEIINDSFIPHDCEKINGFCNSKISELCKWNKDGKCNYKY